MRDEQTCNIEIGIDIKHESWHHIKFGTEILNFSTISWLFVSAKALLLVNSSLVTLTWSH